MKQNQKTRRANTLFTLAALVVVLMSNVQTGRAVEPDPRILWVADSALGRVDGFAVHPNGNIFSHRNLKKILMCVLISTPKVTIFQPILAT